MSIFGLDDIAPGGMWGAPAPKPKTPSVPYYSDRQSDVNPYDYFKRYPENTPWEKLFKKAYMGAFNQEIHLGNMFDVIQPKDLEGEKPEKRTREKWRGGERIIEEYWHMPDFDHNLFRETVHNAVRQGQADRVEYDGRSKLERETWAQQDKEKADADEIVRKSKEIEAAMERRRKAFDEQAKYQAAVNAAQNARQQNMASQSMKRFAADPAAAYGGGGSSAASQKLLSHKGLENDSKLGGSQKLGRKTLLSGA